MVVLLVLAIALAFLAAKLAFQSNTVVMKTPGMPNDAVIEKSSMDKGSQMATLYAVTNNLCQINPANIDYLLEFLQNFLSPKVYTRISAEMREKAATLKAQRELGSYYCVLRGYDYDADIDRHFIKADLHTVNAAKDSSAPYVFEYATHIENYRLWVDDIKSYEGDKEHNAEWLKNERKNKR